MRPCTHTHTHSFNCFQAGLSRLAPHILLLLRVPSMVNLGEIKLHIGVDYGKKTEAMTTQVVTLPSVSVCDQAAHPAFCAHTGRLCVSSPPDDSQENYRESICQTMRLLLRECRFLTSPYLLQLNFSFCLIAMHILFTSFHTSRSHLGALRG